MSAGEILWRVRGAVRDRVDRVRGARLGRERPWSSLTHHGHEPGPPPFGVPWADQGAVALPPAWREALRAEADRARQRRLAFFDQDEVSLGDPLCWNRDAKHDIVTPTVHASRIDYRDFAETGDCKFVWEPNRHLHLVVLARAYRATGESGYAEAVVGQIDSWLAQNPFGRGMNWRSPLELAIRVINWVWAVDLIRDSALVDGAFRLRLWNSVRLHLWDIARKFSRGSSANNHLIGEAAGVYVGASYFADLKGTARWRRRSREILIREARRQTFADGGNREQAIGYHVFVLQFLMIAGLVGRWGGEEFPAGYWQVIEEMLAFLAAMGEGGGDLPMYGDADDGYVLDLGDGARGWRGWLAAGAALLGRGDWKAVARHPSPTLVGLLGPEGMGLWERAEAPAPAPLAGRALPESGWYLLQHGSPVEGDTVSVLVDCGPLGYLSIAPHGHADALSVVVRAFGHDLLVDPGTYDYFTYPAWRAHFRHTRCHNTVEVDGQDQSEMLGAFMWGRKARARCLQWAPTDRGGTVVGEHDGYTRLADPVTHRRGVTLDGAAGRVEICDELLARGDHDVTVVFQFAETCEVEQVARHRVRVSFGEHAADLTVDPALTVSLVTGQEDPPVGWVSRGYHRRTPATVVLCRATIQGAAVLRSVLTVTRGGAGGNAAGLPSSAQ